VALTVEQEQRRERLMKKWPDVRAEANLRESRVAFEKFRLRCQIAGHRIVEALRRIRKELE
jgi:hypothetical protein